MVKKRLFTLLLSLALLFNFSVSAMAAESIDTADNVTTSIALSEIDADAEIKAIISDYYIHSTGFAKTDSDSIIVAKDGVQILRLTDDNIVESTLISAFDEGGIVDMRDVAATIASSSDYITRGTITEGIPVLPSGALAHFAVSCTVTYGFASNADGYRFYRPTSIAVSWTPTGNNSVSNLTAELECLTVGDLILSPDCLDDTLSYNDLCDLVVESDYEHSMTINRSSTWNSGTSLTASNPVASNRAIWAHSQWQHWSKLYYRLYYTCNGNSYDTGTGSDKYIELEHFY